jgi:hypothetical protein
MKYNYSYSGADCDVYAVRRISTYTGDRRTGSAQSIIHLDNIATVSVSMYEAKAPVRRLGHASPVGFTGNIRSIAGSLIFIVKSEHPLGVVMRNFGQLHKHLDDDVTQKGFSLGESTPNNTTVFNAGMIHPFDLMLMYKNEVDARGAGLRINNLEFISEGIVTSVNDIVSEVVLQFVATDIDQLELEKVRGGDVRTSSPPTPATSSLPTPVKAASKLYTEYTVSFVSPDTKKTIVFTIHADEIGAALNTGKGERTPENVSNKADKEKVLRRLLDYNEAFFDTILSQEAYEDTNLLNDPSALNDILTRLSIVGKSS